MRNAFTTNQKAVISQLLCDLGLDDDRNDLNEIMGIATERCYAADYQIANITRLSAYKGRTKDDTFGTAEEVADRQNVTPLLQAIRQGVFNMYMGSTPATFEGTIAMILTKIKTPLELDEREKKYAKALIVTAAFFASTLTKPRGMEEDALHDSLEINFGRLQGLVKEMSEKFPESSIKKEDSGKTA